MNEVPLGIYKLEIGLQLSLVNGILYNSEAWHSISQQEIQSLEKIDESLLRFLLNSHSKAPLEALYLESGAIPIKFIISSRRLNFLQTIMKRDEEELTKRVLLAQINDPTEGDFGELVKKDFQSIGVVFDLSYVESTGVEAFRNHVKNKIRKAAFEYLKNVQKNHNKVKDIKYERMETQPYLKSPLFSNEETKLLFSLRTRTSEMFKGNFRNLHGGKVDCPLKCWASDQLPVEDKQEHILSCTKLKLESSNVACTEITYNDIFGEVQKQKEAINLFKDLMELKEKLLENQKDCPPGVNLDLSIGSSCCCGSALLTSHICINCTLTGK